MTPETLNWGITAGIVPGNLGGYVTALQRFGTMSLAEVFASAIDYAEHGYPIDPTLAAAIARAKASLEKYPDDGEDVPARTASRRRPVSCSGIPTSRRRCARWSTRSRQALKQKKRRAQARRGGVRSLLQGRHRAGVRSVLQGEPRRHDGGGPGRLSSRSGRSRCTRRTAATTSTAIRRRRAAASSSRCSSTWSRDSISRRWAQNSPEALHVADRSDQGREGGRLPLRRGSEVHADPDGRAAVEELRRLASHS